MVIQHNIAAINSYRNLGINQSGLNKNLEKLSSGYKINRAGDDAAGLAISEAMRSQINGLNQAAKNAQDAVGLIQTAEGALTEVHSMLQRLTTLASQAANGTYNTVARGNLQSEVDELLKEIDRIANYTDFNGIKPLADVGSAGKMTFQIGPSRFETITVTSQAMTVFGIDAAIKGIMLSADLINVKSADGRMAGDYKDFRTDMNNKEAKYFVYKESLNNPDGKDYKSGINGATVRISIADVNRTQAANGSDPNNINSYSAYVQKLKSFGNFKANGQTQVVNETIHALAGMRIDGTATVLANYAIDTINKAINEVSGFRAKLGAAQNRLEHTINNLKVTSENITAAESRIRDTDMADEITAFTKNNILLQASQSMLAQSNSVPQGVLSLLQ